MDFLDLLLTLVCAAAGWFWVDTLRAREIARDAGKRACLRAGVQFLDDTVAGTGVTLSRDGEGRRAIRRTYRFEFSDTGDNRLEGSLVLLGGRVEYLFMEPYRMTAAPNQ
ncbi:MAG: DUF3301 domain-containing protein [Sulfuricella sp.]|nr:DUF3301 domain-containing protein [Sulfuricella sp.]